MNEPMRILLADDHQILRGGLQAIIDFEADMQVVGHATTGDEAVILYQDLKPNVVIMDLVMPGKDGVEATRDILADDPGARILVLTSFSESDRIKLAMRAGALGYILKNARPEELLQAIRQVCKGLVSVQPAILQQLLRQEDRKSDIPVEELTPREYEVLKLVAQGLNNAQIAEQLSISKRTVNVHITRIMGKLGLENRAQAVLYALRQGMLGVFPESTKR